MYNLYSAAVAELADALDLGSSGRKAVEVRVLSAAGYFLLLKMFGRLMQIKCNNKLFLARGHESVDEYTNYYKKYADRYSILQFYGSDIRGVNFAALEKRYEKISTSQDIIYWAIEDLEKHEIIANMRIFKIDYFNSLGHTAILISNKSYWRQGLGYCFAAARTLYAAKILDLAILFSYAFKPNVASWKNLEKLGYIRYGEIPASIKINGEYITEYEYVWYNPSKLKSVFKGEIPERVQKSVQISRQILKDASTWVEFL